MMAQDAKAEKYLSIIRKETKRNDELELANEALRKKTEHLVNVLQSWIKRQKSQKSQKRF